MNCPNVLAHGTCSDAGCLHKHNVLACEHCSLLFQTDGELKAHLTTDKHRNRATGYSAVLGCPICSSNHAGGESGWKLHVGTRRHRANAARQGVSPDIEPQGPEPSATVQFCDICQFLIPPSDWNAHIKGNKHKNREMFTRYRSAIEEAETDKNGVSVSGRFDFEFVEPGAAATGVRNIATITTSIPSSRVRLLDARLASSQGAKLVVPA